MTIGKKIKLVKKLSKITQQKLWEAVDTEGKEAANHIAQNDMLIDIEKAININPLLFVNPVPGSAEDIMQTFF